MNAELRTTCEFLEATQCAQLRAELDARFVHVCGLTPNELPYILDPSDIHGLDSLGERLVQEAWDKLPPAAT